MAKIRETQEKEIVQGGERTRGGFITAPLNQERQVFEGASAPGARSGAVDLLRAGGLPDAAGHGGENELTKEVMEGATMLLGPGEVKADHPVRTYTVDGFVNTVAQEVFERTGQRDEALRTDDLVSIFGPDLHVMPKHYSNNAGFNNEGDFAKQLIGEWLAREEILTLRGPFELGEERRKVEDDIVGSQINQKIEQYFGKFALGSIRSRAKELDVSNNTVLRAALALSLQIAKRRGLCGDYTPPPADSKGITTKGEVLEVIVELLGQLGLGSLLEKVAKRTNGG